MANNTETATQPARIPPQAIEIEMAVLGAMLIEPECIPSVTAVLQPVHFYLSRHQRIFEALRLMDKNKEAIDTLTVAEKLKSHGFLEEIGGTYYLSECCERVVSAANVEYHCRIILEKALVRNLIDVATRAANDGYAGGLTANDMASGLLAAASGIQDELHGTGSHFKGTQELTAEVMDEVEWYENNKGKVKGVYLGYESIARLIPSIEPGELMLLAARPSMGKTAFACNVTRSAMFSGETVGWILLESVGKRIMTRMACQQARINNYAIKQGRLSEEEKARFFSELSRINTDRIWLSESPGCTLDEMRTHIQMGVHKHGCTMFIVDYIQEIRARGENRNRELEQVMGELKSAAIRLRIPIIALSQLSRDIERRPDKKPVLADLRDSGALEQGADIVAFLYREVAYAPKEERPTFIKNLSTGECRAEFIVRKNRDGACDAVDLTFYENFGVFEDGWI